MTPEPPLGMDPDQRNVWDAGAESYRRGLPITADHPYCCAMKDVWEMGWKAASEAAQVLPPDDYAHWAKIGEEDYANGKRINRDMTMKEWAAYSFGFMDAGRRAMASKAGPPLDECERNAWKMGVVAAKCGRAVYDNPFSIDDRIRSAWEKGWLSVTAGEPTTTQALIDTWEKARNELRAHVWKLLPYDCAVVVDNQRYKGPGVIKGYPSDDMSQIEVTIPNGNTWHYPITSVRRVQ